MEDFNGNRNLSGKRGRKYGCWLTYSGLIQVCKELFEMDNLQDADTEDEMIFGKYKELRFSELVHKYKLF